MPVFLVFFRISVRKAKHIVQSYKSQWMNMDASAGQWCWSSASGMWTFACQIKYENMEKMSSVNTLRAYLTLYTWLIKVNPPLNLFSSQNFWFHWTTTTLSVFCHFTILYCPGMNSLCLFKNLHKKQKKSSAAHLPTPSIQENQFRQEKTNGVWCIWKKCCPLPNRQHSWKWTGEGSFASVPKAFIRYITWK